MTQKEYHKLNLGCGLDHRAGYINIDAVAAVNPDIVHDLTRPLPFKDDTVEEVVAQDILEHFIYDDFLHVLAELSRVVVTGGKVHVRVPNVDAVFEQFAEDKEVRNIFLYGSTSHRSDTGVFGAHKIGFTARRLVAEFLVYGFEVSSLRTVETNFEAVFVKKEVPSLKKILFVNQSLSMGGAEVFDDDLLGEFSKQGVSCVVSTTSPSFAKLLSEKLSSSSTTMQLFPSVVDIIGNWKGLVKAIVFAPLAWLQYGWLLWKERDADVLFASGFSEKILTSFWAWLFGIPVVWTEFGPLSTVMRRFFGLPKLLYRLALLVPERIIVPSHTTLHDVLPLVHLPLAKSAVIPCGSSQIPAETFEEPTEPHIVCISRLEKGKGQDLLLHAFKEVRNAIPKATLTIVGEGDFLSELQQLSELLGISDAVTFAGRVPSVEKELAAAQIVVFPSVWALEGFGLGVIEAMAAAKPVVAYNRGPTNEIVLQGKTGLLVTPGESLALAGALRVLLASKAARRALGMAGLQRYKEEYSISKVSHLYRTEFCAAMAWSKVDTALERVEYTESTL